MDSNEPDRMHGCVAWLLLWLHTQMTRAAAAPANMFFPLVPRNRPPTNLSAAPWTWFIHRCSHSIHRTSFSNHGTYTGGILFNYKNSFIKIGPSLILLELIATSMHASCF